MQHVLAVDAGGTKTVALVANSRGEVLGAGRGGCGDVYADPQFVAVGNAIDDALRGAGLARGEIAVAAFSMAGLDWPEDFDFVRDAMHEWLPGAALLVVNDSLGALRLGSPDRTGVSVICGTGTATGARGIDGREWHTSFWQGTQGSLHLAEKALMAVYRADLGLDPPTSLAAAFMEFYGVASVEAVLHHLTHRASVAYAGRGKLARLVLDEAARGDPIALAIVTEHGTDLGRYARVAAARVGLLGEPAFALVLGGSVLRHSAHILADAVIREVWSAAPGAQPVFIRHEPVVGGLFMALDQLGIATDDALHARLIPTLPPPSLFAT